MSNSETEIDTWFRGPRCFTSGSHTGFAGLWFQTRGMTPDEIGLIFAIPIVGVILAGIPVGRLADRMSDWRQAIVAGSLLSAIVPLGLLLVETFVGHLIVWTLAVVTQVATIPIIDAAAIRRGRREGGDLGRLYAWKTTGYLTAVFGTGLLIAEVGIAGFLPAYLAFSVLRGLCAFPLPRFRAAPPKERSRILWITSADRTVLLPLLGWALVHCTHSILNAFLGVLWFDQGVTAAMVGVLIAFSAIVETGVFVTLRTLILRFKPTTLITISCLAGVVRWTGFALSPPIEILFLLQLLHGLTYAVGFVACTNLIADRASEEVAAEAQSVFSILQSGVSATALIAFGVLAGAVGPRAFLASAVLAGLGAALVVASKFHEARGSVAG